MSYKITITETTIVTKTVGKVWDVIGEKEVMRGIDLYERLEPGEPKTRIEQIRGYTPEIEKQQEVSREVLSQEVENLDLVAVIKAINSIP